MTTANRYRFRPTTETKDGSRFAAAVAVTLAVAAIAAAGCGSNMGGGSPTGGSIAISGQPLAGKIGGQPWSFVNGETDAFLSDATSFFTTLYPTAYTACSFGKPTNVSSVLVQLPTAPGGYDVTLAMNATLYDVASNTNWVATRGRVVVDSVTATTVTGGLHIIYNGDNTVDGQFQVTICPPSP